nr:hypothetical protein [Tanacetum cinerariifolium]
MDEGATRSSQEDGTVATAELFKESVMNCFGPSKYEDLKGTLSKLLQLDTVEEYQGEFEKLMNHVTDIPNSLLISFYISGLKLHLQREFFGSRPTTLGDVFLLAQTIEARLDDQATLVAGTMTKTFRNHGGDESESSGPVTPTEDDDQSFLKEESYLSGDYYFLSKQIMMDEDELNLPRPVFML